jgi:DNA-directed RNA polymerase specialized sigma24 family protein
MDIQGWAVGVSRGEERTGAALLRAAQAGDPAALDQLFSPHARGLLLFCRGILGHAEDAEDAAQETLFRALRALPRFQQRQAAFRTWLFRIALNLCLDWKRDHRPTEPWDEEKRRRLPRRSRSAACRSSKRWGCCRRSGARSCC